MRTRAILLVAVTLASLALPIRGVVRVEAANTTCLPTATGEPITPGINFGIGEIFATEDIQGTGECASATGDTWTGTVTVQAEYLNLATLTWTATSCPAVIAPTDSFAVTSNPNTSASFGIASTGCNYLPGDPSLNTLHRAHTYVVTSNGVNVQATSDPYFLG